MANKERHSAVVRRLRVKIVVITMAMALIVMTIAASAMLAVSWNSSYQDIHKALTHATENGPSESYVVSVGKYGSRDRGPDAWIVDDSSLDYMPLTAVFVVDGDGTILDSNSLFVTMDDDVRDAAIASALAQTKNEGLLSAQGVFYQRAYSARGITLAFVDAGYFNAQVASSLRLVLSVSAFVLIGLLAVSVLLAYPITRPVERAWSQQREFVANASHELKTPLTVIIANNDILKASPAATVGEQAKWVDGISYEAGRMKGLIEDMLALAHDEQVDPRERMSMAEVDLSTLVRQATLSFDAVAFESGVEIVEQVEDNQLVHGDKAALERLVRTLVDNALKYAGMGGRVQVRLSHGRKGHPVFSVNNTGEPIDKADLPHVFDRFWRSDAARSREGKVGGYGLGLAIAKSIAQTHGARISVTSTEQEGTTFTVAF